MAEGAKTIDKALRILTELGVRQPATAAELAGRCGLNRTVAQRLLLTLRQRDFVFKDEQGYRLSPFLAKLADTVQPRLRSASRETMRELADQTGKTVALYVLDGESAVVLQEARGGPAAGVRVRHEVGARAPLRESAGGLALLAFGGGPGGPGGSDPAAASDLEGIAAAGHALTGPPVHPGVVAIAVPVLGADGRAVASQAMLAPSPAAAELSQQLPLLVVAAARVSELLGADGTSAE